jgi:hypothetical protein
VGGAGYYSSAQSAMANLWPALRGLCGLPSLFISSDGHA